MEESSRAITMTREDPILPAAEAPDQDLDHITLQSLTTTNSIADLHPQVQHQSTDRTNHQKEWIILKAPILSLMKVIINTKTEKK